MTNEERYPHLPSDVLASLDEYAEDVESGKIQFGTKGFADEFPDHTNPANDLPAFIAGKLPEFER